VAHGPQCPAGPTSALKPYSFNYLLHLCQLSRRFFCLALFYVCRKSTSAASHGHLGVPTSLSRLHGPSCIVTLAHHLGWTGTITIASSIYSWDLGVTLSTYFVSSARPGASPLHSGHAVLSPLGSAELFARPPQDRHRGWDLVPP
jgi:hypothetical protein